MTALMQSARAFWATQDQAVLGLLLVVAVLAIWTALIRRRAPGWVRSSWPVALLVIWVLFLAVCWSNVL